MEAAKVKKRKERACLVGVCCHRGPESAESEWVGPPGYPEYSGMMRGPQRQVPQQHEEGWLQLHWRAPQQWQ